MKNQYFGDLNDYLKYGMLRAFGREMTVAVIWMMTPDDGSRDGQKHGYLKFEGRRGHDPELFDWLRAWYRAGARKDVPLIERSGLLQNCRFFGEIVPDEPAARAQWFERARDFARGSDLVFVDPDNGLPVKSVRPGAHGWSKYVALEELKALYEDDHSLLIYQHTARTTKRDLIRTKLGQLYECFGLERFESAHAFDWVGFVVENWGHVVPVSKAMRRLVLDWDSAITVASDWIVPVPMTAREIKERPRRTFREALNRRTTKPGYVNGHDRQVLRATDLVGTDHGQKVYALRCLKCGHEYGANGSDIHLRKCPSCQGGAVGLAY